MSAEETYSLAHTARCKLQMAADRPDRNLRFILGHAFTLDKLMLRVVEIESESSESESSSDDDNAYGDFPTATNPERERRVSFQNNAKPQVTVTARNRSPPPGGDADGSDEEYAVDDEEDEEGKGLSLRRFKSAAAQPPRLIDDQDDDPSDEDEPVSPPSMPTELELQSITTGPESEELAHLYQNVKRCPCHGHQEDAPTVEKAWEVPQKVGHQGKRIAVVQVMA